MKQYGVRPSVRPSVCSIRPLQHRAAGLLLWARRAGVIDRLLQQRRAASECRQCHVVSVRIGSRTQTCQDMRLRPVADRHLVSTLH